MGSSPVDDRALASPYDRPLNQYEPYDELDLVEGNEQPFEESMRVMYEDPGQRDEKKRLMSLFESQNQGGDESYSGGRSGTKKGASAIRRSTRMAGF